MQHAVYYLCAAGVSIQVLSMLHHLDVNGAPSLFVYLAFNLALLLCCSPPSPLTSPATACYVSESKGYDLYKSLRLPVSQFFMAHQTVQYRDYFLFHHT